MSAAIGSDLDLLIEAATKAGALAMSFFRKNPSAWAKEGGSPVTEADMAVDVFLRTELLAARPNYGWLSEETADDPARCGLQTIFCVDPIDGTRGFMEGDDRWCVSLAVVRDGRPTVAVLFAPVRDELYTGTVGGGAHMRTSQLKVSEQRDLRGSRLAGPRGWLKHPRFKQCGARIESHVPSLAYRFTQVATARSDAAFASPRAHDWDLAACDLLVHEAGGRLTGLDGLPPMYNREVPRHGVLAAANPQVHPELLAMLADVARERSGLGQPS